MGYVTYFLDFREVDTKYYYFKDFTYLLVCSYLLGNNVKNMCGIFATIKKVNTKFLYCDYI